MSENKRTWISAIIGLVAVAIIIWLSPSPIYKACGILLPAKQTRPPIAPSSVVQIATAPASAEIMGYINIERHYPDKHKEGQEQIGKLAQELAAQCGANAILVSNFRLGEVAPSHYIYVFQGTAYYVPSLKHTLELQN